MTPDRCSVDSGCLVTSGAIALATLLFASSTPAQVSASAAIVSDYRFRGVSLSENKPAAQLSVAYDHPSGWYAGAFGSSVQFPGQTARTFQMVSYAGYAKRLDAGLSWEAGADYSVFTSARDYNYAEVYAGIDVDRVTGRIHYAPDYFGQTHGTIYAELNATQRVLDRIDLIGHIGALRSMGGGNGPEGPLRFQFDIRAGLGTELYGVALQVAWVGTNITSTSYPVDDRGHRNGVVLSVSRSF